MKQTVRKKPTSTKSASDFIEHAGSNLAEGEVAKKTAEGLGYKANVAAHRVDRLVLMCPSLRRCAILQAQACVGKGRGPARLEIAVRAPSLQ